MGEVVHAAADIGDGDIVVIFKILLLPSMTLPVNDCVGGADVDTVIEEFVGGASECRGPWHTESLSDNCQCLLWNHHFWNRS